MHAFCLNSLYVDALSGWLQSIILLLFPPLFNCRLIYSARFVCITREEKNVHGGEENLQLAAAGTTHACMRLAGGEENLHIHHTAKFCDICRQFE